MRALATLFSPIRVGSMSLRNRLVMSPMETGYGTRDGLPSPRTIAYFAARARGGVGLVTLGACTVDPRHREVPRSLHFGDDAVIEAHRALVDAVHAHGACIQPQLVHPGPDGLAPYLAGEPNVGPSVIPSYLTGVPCRELAAEEIPALVERFRAAAGRVRAAGYDGIELHAAHGYMLLGSFLTPTRNRRSDAYAGTTPEGRIRLIVEVVAAIKSEVGADFPVTLRLSGSERVAGGRGIEDTQRIAPALVAAGVDAFHVSGGVIDPWTTQMVTGSHWGDAHNAAAAESVKQVVDVPVTVVGRIHDPVLAERLLREGRADLVAMARPLLADPDLPEKARSGRLREIRRCISCQSCIDSMEVGRMACAVNAFTGREADWPLAPAARPRSVVVVGGGPGGLEAARVAATRGHRVRLFERGRRLGGALVLAATVHPDNRPLLDFLCAEVARLGVEVRLGRALDADAVAALAPDAVIVATGGRIASPSIPGDDAAHVWTGAGLRAWLSGDSAAGGAAGPVDRAGGGPRGALRWAGGAGRWLGPRGLRALSRGWLPFGRRVAVVGEDLAAVELAEFLAERGRRVALLAAGETLAPEVGAKRRHEHAGRLERLGVVVHTGARVRRIADDAVEWSLAGDGLAAEGAPRRVPADHVIIAGALEPDDALARALEGRVPEVHAVGDCTGLGLVRKAIEEAAHAASAL